MSHGPACSESTSTRCKCSCRGSGHGVIGAPLYRSIASSYDSTGSFVVNHRYVDQAVDLLVELVKKAPTDTARIYTAVQDVVSENAWQLLLPSNPRGRRVGRRHWLCQILAEVAEMLDQVADIAGTIEDAVNEQCLDAGWGRLRSKAAGTVAGRLAQVSLGPALAPVAVLSMKVRIAAVMFCPDVSKHPALENACARQVLAALGVPTGAVA